MCYETLFSSSRQLSNLRRELFCIISFNSKQGLLIYNTILVFLPFIPSPSLFPVIPNHSHNLHSSAVTSSSQVEKSLKKRDLHI